MAGLMESSNFFLFIAEYMALALWPQGDLFDSLMKVRLSNFFTIRAGCKNGGFVGDVAGLYE
jgi:hypothetical protein